MESIAAGQDREWLETNGLGGFALSTVTGIHTRRYHALLTAAAPSGRFCLLSKVEETLIVRAVARAMDIADGENRFQTLADCRYPEPDEPHPAGSGAQARKIAFARARASNVYALAHGYGPVDDYRQRLEVAWKASGGRVWINRYGYLSDAKLDATGAVTE